MRIFLFIVILRLSVPELVVFAAYVGNECIVVTALDKLAFVENGDLVAEFAGG